MIKKNLLFILLMICCDFLSSQVATNFYPQVTFSVGSNPCSIISADFNGDGYPDIATANFNSNNISVLFGDGNGNLLNSATYNVQLQPISLVGTDVNNDGKQDMVVANSGSSSISVLLNNGNGIFTSITNYNVRGVPSSILSEKINGDGNVDLEIVYSNIDSVSVLYGTGSGSFSLPAMYTSSASGGCGIYLGYIPFTSYFAVVTLNNISNTVNRFPNGDLAGGSWITPIDAGAQIAYHGAFQGFDNNQDLIIGYSNSDSISTYLGNPGFSPNFQYKKNFKAGNAPTAILLGDFDFDFDNDIITTNSQDDNVSILYNIGNIGAQNIYSSPNTLAVGSHPKAMVLADLNQDGRNDIVTANKNSNNVSVLLSNVLPSLVEITSSDDTICSGESATLYVSGAITSYTWSTGDISVNPVVSPTITTTYTIHATDAYYGSILTKTLTVYVSSNIASTVSISANDSLVCRGDTVTLMATGSVNYLWSTYETGTNTISVYPLSTNSYSVTGYDNNNCMSTAIITISVSPGVETLFTDTIICLNESINLVAYGATSYTWSTGQNTPTVSISPTISSSYYVTGVDINNCVHTQTINVQPLPTPSITLTAPSTICFGESATIFASGANTYTWTNNQNNNFLTVSPSSLSSFSVSGTLPGFCIGSQTISIDVLPTPTINISSSNNNLCPGIGAGAGLKASGANTYTWSTTAISDSIYVTPTVSETFTVYGTSANNCESSTTQLINVLPPMHIDGNGLGANTMEVCVGASINLSFIYANTYTWSTGENTSAINVSPLITTSYSAFGVDTNGCSSVITVTVNVNQTCQYIWPGDANSDGLVDNIDFLEMCLHLNSTGPARTGGLNPQNFWVPHYADNWTGILSNGKNMNHSDCNGDGIINATDTIEIYTHCYYNHNFKPSAATENLDEPIVKIIPDQPILQIGKWGSSSIYIGDASTIIDSANGFAYKISMDYSLIEKDSVFVVTPSSFINLGGANLNFNKSDSLNGIFFSATSHPYLFNSSGYGKIAEVHYKINPSLVLDTVINFNIQNATKVTADGLFLQLSGGNSSVVLTTEPVTIKELNNTLSAIIYPNPASTFLKIISDKKIDKIELSNVTGQIIIKEFIHSNNYRLYLENIENGIYFINLYNDDRIVKREKIIINN